MLPKDLHVTSCWKGKKHKKRYSKDKNNPTSFCLTNVHDELRRSFNWQAHTSKQEKAPKATFFQGIYTRFFPTTGITCVFVCMVLFVCLFSTHFWFLRISHSIQQFLKSHLRKVCALLPSPSNTSTLELNSPPSPLIALMEKGCCLQTQALLNLSRLNGSCLPKTAGQLFLEDAKNTIYGQSKQKSSAGKSDCNTYSIIR